MQFAINISSLIANLVTVVGIGYVAKQFIRDKKNRTIDFEWQKRARSADLAEKYPLFIRNELGVVLTVYEQLEIFKLIDFIKFEEIKYFNTIEMNLLFENNEKTLSTIKKATQIDKIPIEMLVIAYLSYDYLGIEERKDLVQLLECWNMPSNIKKSLKPEEQKKFDSLERAYDIILRTKFIKDLEFVMNHLEWISLSINSNVSTDQLLYDVVSPTFLKVCKLLYVRICEANGEYSRAYLNLAQLYRTWAKKLKVEDNKQRKLKEERANNGGVSYKQLNNN